MTFELALIRVKKGKRIQRKGWNGKGMWIALAKPDGGAMQEVEAINGKRMWVEAGVNMTLPYIYMKTADDQLVPWLASQTDILAGDWSVLPEEAK